MTRTTRFAFASLIAAAHTPWWALASLIVILVGAGAVRAVFPQDSSDRLEWWRGRWAHVRARQRKK